MQKKETNEGTKMLDVSDYLMLVFDSNEAHVTTSMYLALKA